MVPEGVRIYEGTTDVEDMDELSGQLDRWSIGFRSDTDFFQIQGDNLWTVIRTAIKTHRMLNK